ncbi:MAG: RNA polymerase sigma factor, partial [Acidimicrobiales bacterium]|nr:RNA polymerase sigma factor [Acidimicrobiales bacterium]
ARNQANRSMRSDVRRSEREQAAWPMSAGDHAAAVASGVDAASDLDLVLAAIEDLPDGSRETLVLHVWGELSYEQIAIELGVSVGTVKSRLHRARGRLAAALRPGAGGESATVARAGRAAAVGRGSP